MKFPGRFESLLEANVGIGGCVSPQPSIKPLKTYRFRGLLTASNLAWEFHSWKRRGNVVEAVGEKSQRKIRRGWRGRDDLIMIAGRWRAPQLMSDRGSRGRSRSCCAGYAASSVNYESGGRSSNLFGLANAHVRMNNDNAASVVDTELRHRIQR